ncbi:MAG TPA: hypothetical protein VFQ53_06460 [Kofleriaceae bacterium]|nr:hypothetical protein [Kofleriaceae bacterium]
MMRAAIVVLVAACGTPVATPRPSCELPPSTVLHHEGTAIVEHWILDDAARWLAEAPAVGPATARFRAAIRAKVDVTPAAIFARQIARYAGSSDPMELGEVHNTTLVRDGKVGMLRPMSCLEAALYERQTARYPEETHPTEFHGFVLRRGTQLDVVMLASDQPFPPKVGLAMPHVDPALAAGWTLWGHLHDHTFEFTADRNAALGTPAPSTTDVQFYRNFADSGLERALVTNGFVTVEIRASELPQLSGR